MKRGLAWCLVAVVLVPVALAVVLGLGGLLGALGDSAAAAACGRIALGLGVVFVVALVATTATTAACILVPPAQRDRRTGRRRGVRRRGGRGAPVIDRPAGPA